MKIGGTLSLGVVPVIKEHILKEKGRALTSMMQVQFILLARHNNQQKYFQKHASNLLVIITPGHSWKCWPIVFTKFKRIDILAY